MTQNTRRLTKLVLAACSLAFSLAIIGTAHGYGGRLLVRLEGALAGPIPPALTLSGPGREESRTMDALALASREILFDGLEPGVYRVGLDAAGSPGSGEESTIEIGIHEGLTAVIRAEIGRGRLAIDPFRPDPFGIEDAWDAAWIDGLPGAGEEGPIAAETSPASPRQKSLDRLDLIGTGFRHDARVRSGSMVRSLRTPLGLGPASVETAARRLLSRYDSSFGEIERATGSRGRNSYEGSLARRFSKVPWDPRVVLSLRGIDFADAAPSVFSSGEKLANNGLKGFDLFGRIDARPSNRTRVNALLYGEGSQRNHFVEAYRHDASHAPRVDRASIEGGVRAVHEHGERLQFLAEIDLQRTYTATGDGTYFDNISGYASSAGAVDAVEENELYWQGDRVVDGNTIDGHAYNYFRRNVQVEWIGRFEAWRDPGTARSAGAGILLRRGTYRSYEHFNPVNSGITIESDRQAIGYDELGEAHSDAEGREPGHPSTMAAFGTARRGVPSLGGEIEVGLRLTRFASGQKPLRKLDDPFGNDELLNALSLGDAVARTTIDPRIAYTRAIGSRWRLWISGGGETRVPPSEALYYSVPFLQETALLAESGGIEMKTVLGNPGLRPERVLDGLAAIGMRMTPDLRFRVGAEGRRTDNAITPRAYSVSGGKLAYYVNEGARDLIDLFVRAEWEPTPRFAARVSYDLSRARTQAVEPELLDAARYEGGMPASFLAQREGLMPVVPSLQEGEAGGFYPSIHDRRHRVSLAFTARTPADLIGESGRILFDGFEASALFRAASGGRFSWTTIYPAGVLPPPEDVQPVVLTGIDPNDGTLPWTGQLDLRIAKAVAFPKGELQVWFEVTNVTDRRNVIRVYQATGEGDDDAALGTRLIPDRLSERNGFASEYAERIQDPANYGEPRLLRAGLRLLLP